MPLAPEVRSFFFVISEKTSISTTADSNMLVREDKSVDSYNL